MNIFAKYFAILFFLLFSASCKKTAVEDPSNCVFTGSTIVRNVEGYIHYKYTTSNDVEIDDEKILRTATRTQITESTDSLATEHREKTTNTDHYTFTYDENGFLKTMVLRKSEIYLGSSNNSYYYKGEPYKNFQTDEVRTYEYHYQSGQIASVSIKVISTYKPENRTPDVIESGYSKVYQYDGNGKPVSAFATLKFGSVTTTFVNGIIATETFRSLNGNISSVQYYNQQGLLSTIMQDNIVFERRYDANGNLVSDSSTGHGEPGYRIEFKSDNHENPETQIPRFFKGIPDPIMTIQATEGGNNLTYEKFTTVRTGNVVYTNNTAYQYNAAGLPESAIMTQSAGKITEITTTSFRYKCQ